MKRPAFQFYPADWRKDVELQSCSMAAQGLWINAMCLAHECEPYGHLTINGKPMTPAQLGRQVGLSAKESEALLEELLDAGVARKTEEGMIYSSRMVRDERLRNVRAESGRLGGNPALLGDKVKPKDNQEVNHVDKQSPTPSSSSSTSSPSLRSGDTANKSRTSRPRQSPITLSQFLEACKAQGVKPVPLDAAVRDYCRAAGISDEMLQIAWLVFKDRHLNADKDKRYKDWGKTFANSVKGRWYGLWFDDAGEVKWTSTGLQEKRVIEARMAEQRQQHEGAPA